MSKIKCTYEECFKHFSSEAAMRKHKDKEHDYCAVCDEDFEDDTALLIHQITSSRHIACPMCGVEFKSSGGRDRHVEVTTPQSLARTGAVTEEIHCAGCEANFERAHAYMGHIEKGECSTIRPNDFHKRRAEAQIEKDAWAAQLDSDHIFSGRIPENETISDGDSETTGGVTVNLMDIQDLPPSNVPGQSARSPPPPAILQPSLPNGYRAPSVPVHGMSNLSLDKFPKLNSVPSAATTSTKVATATSDLMDLDEEEHRVYPRSSDQGAWQNNLSFRNKNNQNIPPGGLPSAPFIPDTSSQISSTTYNPQSFASNNRASIINSQITTKDNNYSHRGVQTKLQHEVAERVNTAKYFDELTCTWKCPGTKCNRFFPTAESFADHLLTGAHVGGSVRCPTCMKMFGSTMALISHAESGSKRCSLRHSSEYDQVIRELTGGILGIDGYLDDGSVRYVAPRMEQW